MDFGAWSITEVMGAATRHQLGTIHRPMRAQLGLVTVDFRMLTGIYLRYLRPVLTIGETAH